jgi:hypothetical protein
VAQWNATFCDLTRAGQLLPSTLATQTLQACFGSEFDQCWVDFVKDVPVVVNRTVLRLCPAILKFGKDVLPLLKAQASIGINQDRAGGEIIRGDTEAPDIEGEAGFGSESDTSSPSSPNSRSCFSSWQAWCHYHQRCSWKASKECAPTFLCLTVLLVSWAMSTPRKGLHKARSRPSGECDLGLDMEGYFQTRGWLAISP